MSGFIQINRALWDNPDFDDGEMTQREAFIWMIAQAAWRKTKARVGKIVVELERGQLAFSVRFLAEKWGWSKSRVHRFLGALEARSTIGTDSGTGVLVITLCKYDDYQLGGERGGTGDGTQAGQQRDSSGTKKKTLNTVNTNNTVTNVTVGAQSADTPNPPKAIEPKQAKPKTRRGTRLSESWGPSPQDYTYATSKGLDPQEINDEADRFRNYWVAQAGRKGVKLDWSAAWRNWVTSEFGPVARKAKQAARAQRSASEADHLDRVAHQLELGTYTGDGREQPSQVRGQERHGAQAYAGHSARRGEGEVIDVDGHVLARPAF